MRLHLSLILIAAVAWPILPAQARQVSFAPNYSPMVMFGLKVRWTDSQNPSAGGYITINNKTSTLLAPDTPAPAMNLTSIGAQLEDLTTFGVGDYFAPPMGVLNGTSFGRSFGWFAQADLPAGYVWNIVQTSASQGLKVYDPYSPTFGQLFTSAADYTVTYDGNSTNYPGPDLVNGASEYTDEMFHPVFAVPAQTGTAFATFTISVATTSGAILNNVTPAYERFNFSSTRNTGTLLLGDANTSGKVDFSDYLALEQNFNTVGTATWAGGDFNGDRNVNFADYLILETHFNTTSAVPEPATLTLLALAAMFVVRPSVRKE